MKIYVTHATSFDFVDKLYKPIKSAGFYNKHDVVLPHDSGKQIGNSKQLIRQIDLLLAEVSYPSTGQGIELGWAEYLKKPIICFSNEEQRISSSLQFVCRECLEYCSLNEMITKLSRVVDEYST